MADRTIAGTDWGPDENDAIVADYFAMLAAEQSGRSYVKRHHSKALMSEIGRSHSSVEFKHMNISAVLAKLGLPMIKGYKPAPNDQNSIIDAIERHLIANPNALMLDDPRPPRPLGVADGDAGPGLFEGPPPATNFDPGPEPERLERLVRKFDPTVRPHRKGFSKSSFG